MRYKNSLYPGEQCAAVCKRPPTCWADTRVIDTDPDGTRHELPVARMFFCTMHGRQHFARFETREAIQINPDTGQLEARVVVTFPSGGSQTQYHLGGMRP